jgi:hypothetical protein
VYENYSISDRRAAAWAGPLGELVTLPPRAPGFLCKNRPNGRENVSETAAKTSDVRARPAFVVHASEHRSVSTVVLAYPRADGEDTRAQSVGNACATANRRRKRM